MNKLSIEELKRLREAYYGMQYEKIVAVLDELIAIRELKGDQVPVAQIVISKNWPEVGLKVIDYYLDKIQRLPVGTELFTAPQKPIESDQVPVATMHRLVNHRTNQEHPWVCSLGDVKASEGDIFRVEVKPLFTAPQKPIALPVADHETEDGYKYYREETVKAAMEAAGGVVKGGE